MLPGWTAGHSTTSGRFDGLEHVRRGPGPLRAGRDDLSRGKCRGVHAQQPLLECTTRDFARGPRARSEV